MVTQALGDGLTDDFNCPKQRRVFCQAVQTLPMSTLSSMGVRKEPEHLDTLDEQCLAFNADRGVLPSNQCYPLICI